MKRRPVPASLPDTSGLPDTSDLQKAAAHPSRIRRVGGIGHETGELHRLLVESVQDYAIFALDPDGYVVSWNAGAQRFKGYTAQEAIGQHFSIFYPRELVEEGFPEFELRTAANIGRFEDEGWRVRKDGSRFWANVVITALRNAEGTLLGFAKVTRDLTARRASEERALADARHVAAEAAGRAEAERRERELRDLADRLQTQAKELEWRTRESEVSRQDANDARRRAEEARERAEEANRAKSQFLASMSHELRTPLNAIGGFTELIAMGLSGPVTEQQVEQLGRIKRSQGHLLGIINDILNFSRIEAGQVSYDLSRVPLPDVAEAVVQMLSPQALSRGVTLDDQACQHDVDAWADRAKVDQIVLNLVSNALKFTPAGGRISLACADDGERVVFVVRDTGIGIAGNQLEQIFEPFVQIGRTLTVTQEGAGLGLAISRDLARAMQGDITVESTVDVGSAFRLTLPRVVDFRKAIR